jgi:hypothetical protein
MNHLKRMWGHYLALVIIITILIFPISWIYKLIHTHYRPEDAQVVLVAISIAIIVFGIWGGQHAYRLHRFIRDETVRRTKGNGKQVVFELFGIEFYRAASRPADLPPAPVQSMQKRDGDDELEDLSDLITAMPRKRRGKQPRYPEDRIRRVVLRWERRDPSFSARTLEEFLEEEFGCGPEGVLLVPSSTFYDWRRNVLKEIEEKQRQSLPETTP